MNRIFLSDTSEDYRLLENYLGESKFGELVDYQSNKAQHDPASYDFILNMVMEQNPGLFNAYTPSELANLKNELSEVVLPTRYDSVSGFNLLDGLVNDVKKAALRLGFDIDLLPLHATLPTGEVSAMAVSIPGASKNFLLFDGQLMTLCHLISKLYASAFVGEQTDDAGYYSTDLSTIKKRLVSQPEIIERLAGVLEAYIYAGRPGVSKPFPIGQEMIRLSECLRVSMEIFIVAHEFGHIYAGHLNNWSVSEFSSESNISWAHKKEFEADYIGLALTLTVLVEKGYDISLAMIGIKLFFSILDLTDKYAQIVAQGMERVFGSTPSPSHPSNKQRRVAIDIGLSSLGLPGEQVDNSKHLAKVFDEVTSLFLSSLIVRRLKTSRNDKCPCQSGRKFKKCCMNWHP